jgi:NAD+ diphosphatase
VTLILASRPNAYTGSTLDRASHLRGDAAWIAAALADPASLFVPIWRAKNLMQRDEAGAQAIYLTGAAAAALRVAEGVVDARWAFLGLLDGTPMFVLDISAVEDPLPLLPDHVGTFEDLRAVPGLLPDTDAAVLAHARGLMHWRARHLFCGVCSASCVPRDAGNAPGQRCTLPWPASSNLAKAWRRRCGARCWRRAGSASARSAITAASPGRFRPASCSASMPRR